MPGPGPVPNRQDAPHLHEAIVDPTQQYILVPDLGADLVRIYTIDQKTNILTAKTPLKAKAGSGPRHGAFTLDPIAGHYVFYLVAEIASSVTAYRVTYGNALGDLTFDEIGVYSSLAPAEPIPATTTGENPGVVAEVAVSVSVTAILLPSPSALVVA
jgi:6-phosphogluconolactonase (cycloisomerase 2 family)